MHLAGAAAPLQRRTLRMDPQEVQLDQLFSAGLQGSISSGHSITG